MKTVKKPDEVVLHMIQIKGYIINGIDYSTFCSTNFTFWM